MTTVHAAILPLRSTLQDPDLVELVEMFVDELPGRIDAIVASAVASDWQQLARLGHQLKGASGSYGFAPLGAAAARLELIAKNSGEPAELQAALSELANLRQRICAS